jgi:hypothetical protein
MIKMEFFLMSVILSLSLACHGQDKSLQDLDYLLLKDGRVIKCNIISINKNKINLELYDMNLVWEFGNRIHLYFIRAIVTSKENIKKSLKQKGIELCNNIDELHLLSKKNIFYTTGGGISKATGDGSEYWNMGFDINGEWFQKVSENIYIGGRAAYNRWSPNEDELKNEFSGISDLGLDVSGSASIIELITSIKFVPSSNQEQQTQFFGQVGAGFYIMNMKAKASASYMGNSVTVSMDESEGKFGINFGAGVIIGDSGNTKFSIYPMYNIIFTEEESTKYFTVNLGILFDN